MHDPFEFSITGVTCGHVVVYLVFKACSPKGMHSAVSNKRGSYRHAKHEPAAAQTNFSFAHPARQRDFDHTDGIVSLVQAGLEKVVRSLHYMDSKKYNKCNELGAVVSLNIAG